MGLICGILKENIYKTAIDYAKEKNYLVIVDLLSKGPQIIKDDDENADLNKEIALLRSENEKLKEKIKQISEKEDTSLLNKVQQLEKENETYKNFLLIMKEKMKELTFFDFEEYEEEKVIGEGSTSKVKIVNKKEKYAMKELLLFDFESMKQFLKECELLFKLRHPCIIRVYGFNYGDEAHKPSIILSLEPKSLEIEIINKNLNCELKNRITVELVLGMRYIHKHKFMHRDLKPMNILLSKNNHVRITDFGLAKEEDISTSRSKGVGTLRFMAPELFDEERENDYSCKVDVYSFGIILVFIITDDYPPFSLNKVVTGVLPKLPEKMSNWVRNIIINCLSVKPENRPSFEEIFEIMKENNFDLFNDSKDQKLTPKQKTMKEKIERRIMKIEAFEFQHQ